MSQILGMSMELGRAYNEIQHLKSRLQGFEDKEKNTLREVEEKHPSKGGHQSNVLNTPSSHRVTPKSVRNIHSGSIAFSNTRAVAVRPNRSENGRKGHNRTNTPEQIIASSRLDGVPIFTISINPQDIRGLINDFVDEIKKWAFKRAFPGELSPEDLEGLTSYDAILEFLRNASATHLLPTSICDVPFS